ncbi:MAG: hypothetical protein KGH71_04020 [Candidatus Micrarchaeota archaeon]|nr:hypothetical protein [Candidatus Micrarchaeota archaeon]
MPRKIRAPPKKEKPKPKPMALWPLYLLLIALIIGYSLDNSIYLGLGAFLIIVIILVLIAKEVKEEASTTGITEIAKELAIYIGAAIAIWLILIFVLQTSSPINAVASCSMLPVLQKGDMVILHGISNFSSFLASRSNVPVVNISAQQFQSFEGNINSEFLAYYAYFNNNKSNISSVLPNGDNSKYTIALYNTECITKFDYLNQPQNLRQCYVGQNPSSNLIKYNYSLGTLNVGNINYTNIQTSSIEIANTTIKENFTNPIVVYATTPQDSFSGAIIHRLVAVLAVNGTYYTLTRGDNNPALDLQFGNYPAAQSTVIGYVLTNFPLIGYLKLIISGQIGATPGCDQVITQH